MATYYVATTGSDSGTGAIGDPWRTIQYGVNQLGGGDTLYIRAGTYVEAVSVPTGASGTSGAHTTIAAYTGETVVIDGEYRLPGGALFSLLQTAINAGRVVPAGDNYRFVRTGDIVYRAVEAPLVNIGADWVDFEDIKITRSQGRNLRIYSSAGTHDNVTVTNCEISYARTQNVTIYGDSDTLDGCDLHHHDMFAQFSRSASELNWGACIAQSPSTGLTVTGCKIHEGWGEGITLASGTTLEDCQIWDCYGPHIYVEKSNDCIIRRNLVWNTSTQFLRGGKAPNGIVITNEEKSSPGTGTGTNTRIYNNIVIGLSKNLVLFSGDPTTYTDIRIYNNTFLNPRDITGGDAYNLLFNAVPTSSFYVYNNIFYTSVGGLLSDGTTGEGALLSFNCYFGHTVPAGMQGTGDVYGNPQMKSPDASILNAAIAGNYQLLETSPCIDAGTSSPAAPTDDYFGNARSTVDIGAHEYGGTISDYLYVDFRADGTVGTAPLTVTLTDSSTSSATITARYWYYRLSGDTAWTLFDSGNNTSALLQINQSGSYDVRLRCVTATHDASIVKESLITAYSGGGGDTGESTPTSSGGIVGMAVAAANTSTGAQTFNLNNTTITPTFAIIVCSAATTAGTPAATANMSVGMTDGTRHRTVGMYAADAAGTSATSRAVESDYVVAFAKYSSGLTYRAEFVSFSAGTVTIDWIVPPPEGYIVSVWAIAADDAYVGDETVASSMTVTAPNFQSDAIFWINGFGAFDASGTNAYLTVGVTTADTTGSISIGWDDAEAAGAAAAYCADGAVVAANLTGGARWSFPPAITATGWTGTLTGSAIGVIAYGCIRLAGNSVWCDVVDTATATGEASTTGPGFLAGAGIGVFSLLTAAGSGATDGTAGAISLGMWAGDTQAGIGITTEDAADPTVSKSHYAAQFVNVVDDDGATAALAATINSNAAGYDLDWTTVLGAATKGVIFVVEGEGATYADWFLPGTTAGLLAGFP